MAAPLETLEEVLKILLPMNYPDSRLNHIFVEMAPRHGNSLDNGKISKCCEVWKVILIVKGH